MQFLKPLASELAQRADGQVKLTVLGDDAPNDPLTLFFEQLGWLDSTEPYLAVLYAPLDDDLAAQLNELRKLEESLGAKLGVLVASPKGSVTPPPDLVQERPWGTVQVPGRYAHVVEAVVKVSNDVTSEAISAHP